MSGLERIYRIRDVVPGEDQSRVGTAGDPFVLSPLDTETIDPYRSLYLDNTRAVIREDAHKLDVLFIRLEMGKSSGAVL